MTIKPTLVATSRPQSSRTSEAGLIIGLGVRRGERGRRRPRRSTASKPNRLPRAAGLQARRSGHPWSEGDRLHSTPARCARSSSKRSPGDEFEVMVRRGKEEITFKPKVVVEPANGNGNGGAGEVARARRGGQGRAGRCRSRSGPSPSSTLPLSGSNIPTSSTTPSASTVRLGSGDPQRGGLVPRQEGSPVDDLTSTARLNDYLIEQSAGGFHLKGKVFDWVEVGKKRSETTSSAAARPTSRPS